VSPRRSRATVYDRLATLSVGPPIKVNRAHEGSPGKKKGAREKREARAGQTQGRGKGNMVAGASDGRKRARECD